jgi:DNA-binding response OmpR family regulator
MTRVLLIDGNRAFAQSVAMSCIADGIAVRLAETLCDGVRYMMEAPVSVVLIDSALMRLSGHDQVRLFDAVAPGVPVAVLVPEGTTVEETVKLQVQGFQVVAKPFEVRDLLAKVERTARLARAHPGATAQVEALCG